MLSFCETMFYSSFGTFINFLFQYLYICLGSIYLKVCVAFCYNYTPHFFDISFSYLAAFRVQRKYTPATDSLIGPEIRLHPKQKSLRLSNTTTYLIICIALMYLHIAFIFDRRTRSYAVERHVKCNNRQFKLLKL